MRGRRQCKETRLLVIALPTWARKVLLNMAQSSWEHTKVIVNSSGKLSYGVFAEKVSFRDKVTMDKTTLRPDGDFGLRRNRGFLIG